MSKVWQYLKQHAYGALTIVTVLLCILGSCIANLAQTDFGNVTKENLTIETSSGHRLGINMLKPKTATNDKPAPTIVFAHGGNGLKEKWGSIPDRMGTSRLRRVLLLIFTDTATPRF